MAVASYSSPIDHTSDAGFRAWGSALSAALALAGLVQTSDTGQINWASVNRSSAGVAAGYEIWRLADSSLYFKLEYGTGSSAAVPQMWITVGTGSNGSGTLTGQTSTRAVWTRNAAATSTAANYSTYVSVGTAHVTVVWGLNGFVSSSVFGGVFNCHRSVNPSDQSVTSDGYMILIGTSSFVAQSVRTASPAQTGNSSIWYTFIAGNVTSSVDANGDNRVWLCWSEYKAEMQPFLGACVYILSEWTIGTTKSLTLFGGTAHTYLAVGLAASGAGAANNASNNYGLAVIYE